MVIRIEPDIVETVNAIGSYLVSLSEVGSPVCEFSLPSDGIERAVGLISGEARSERAGAGPRAAGCRSRYRRGRLF